MRAADFSRLNVDERVALQRAVVGAVERAGKEDVLRFVRLELLHELARIETLAEHDERRRTEDRGLRIEALVRLYDFQRIVLRLEAADVQDVISFRETETREDVAVVFDRKLGAVWNHDRFDCVVVAV